VLRIFNLEQNQHQKLMLSAYRGGQPWESVRENETQSLPPLDCGSLLQLSDPQPAVDHCFSLGEIRTVCGSRLPAVLETPYVAPSELGD
jgi:hypothetical protein